MKAMLLGLLVLNLAPTYAVAGSEKQARNEKGQPSPAQEKTLRQQDPRKNIEREFREPRAL